MFAQMGMVLKKFDIVLNDVLGSKLAIVDKFVAWKRSSVYEANLQNIMLDIFEHNLPCLDTDFARENASDLDDRVFQTLPMELEILSGFIANSMIPFVKELYAMLLPSLLLYNPLAQSNHSLILNKANSIDLTKEPIFEYQNIAESETLFYERIYVPSKITFSDFDTMCKKLKRTQCLKLLDHPLILRTCNVIISMAVAFGRKFLTNFSVYYFGEKRVGKGRRARYLQELFFTEFSPIDENEQSPNSQMSPHPSSNQYVAVLSYLLAQMSSDNNEIDDDPDQQNEPTESTSLNLLDAYSEDICLDRLEQNIEMRRSSFLECMRAEGNDVSLENLDRQILVFLVRNILLLLRSSSDDDRILGDKGSVAILRRCRLTVLQDLRKSESFQPGIISRSQDLTDAYIKFILPKCREILGLGQTKFLKPLAPGLGYDDAKRLWDEIEDDLKSVAAASIFLYPYCFDNPEVFDFLLKYLKGHEIPGQWHKKVLLLYGNSDSGKTYFLNLLRNVFKTGDNYVISCGSLVKASGDLNQIINPFSENLMVISEEPKTMDISTLKQLVSAGPVGSRQMFSENYVSKFVNAKLWCSSNIIPIIFNSDQGADTRYLVLHFKHKFLQLGKFGQISIDRVAPPEIALQITRKRYIQGVDDCAIIKGFYLLPRTHLLNLVCEENGIINLLVPKMIEEETARVLCQMDHYLQFKKDMRCLRIRHM